MVTYDISLEGMFFSFFLLIIPVLISYYLDLKLISSTLESALRMVLQLLLVGVFLTFVFDLNNPVLNIVWVLVMVFVASHTVLKNAELKTQNLLPLLTIFMAVTNYTMLLYFNKFIIDLTDLFDARYFIPIAGMVLGNSLKANVIGMDNFCNEIQRNENRYLFRLSMGAEKIEALVPYLRKSIRVALKPTIANMATIGIVFLPGMMTGQILAGASPLVAIKYQIAIMLAIYVTTMVNVLLGVFVLIYRGFDEYGMFKKEMLRSS
ncbi:MAG: UDP-glucose/iron transport system permease protein [Methanolobus sp.]|jgi:putative ABC transport system permease protein|uniref:Putative ABC transport system permease protein n=1 Tax=Methanolobus vulcani TaxID=38026 RepID=A0A7Z7FCU0_9EURY|nr:ABC transporter permease [Methanolobus vulcani]MDI3486165.1 UDP-glucose/iron transport system permease protein [Methanolobus sp.]MDK2825070.1 UDP-glucose/iron transport system permease protein [Methanolobus sp.]MDK2939024.1 UDP-glucose/iron transport system permease protein [Methanolobus sp.]SDF87915.1 putative ABC transport system permease protein [Methanolobus vulcani]